jgi:NADPH:quinone reductase-like Zn-dependent oxidoreductase
LCAWPARVQHKYGSPDVLKLQEVDKPEPRDGEVLLRVHASSVNQGDWIALTGRPYAARVAFGLFRPKRRIPGMAVAGRVEAVGRNVTQFEPGDDVFGEVPSAYAEYVCVPQERIWRKPTNLTFEQAAAVPVAGMAALQGLRDKGRVGPGRRVLINGASGGVGTFAVQIAKALGADVTGVCSGRNAQLVRSIGADRVIDYTREDFTHRPERYDLILDNVGNHSLLECRRVLNPGGIYVMVGGQPGRWIDPIPRGLSAFLLSRFVSQEMSMMLAELNGKDLATLADLAQAGKVNPVIDRRYPLREVPAALSYLEAGHARGKVVIDVQ